MLRVQCERTQSPTPGAGPLGEPTPDDNAHERPTRRISQGHPSRFGRLNRYSGGGVWGFFRRLCARARGENYREEEEYDLALEEYGEAIELQPYYTDQSIVPFRERSELIYIFRSVQRSVEIYLLQGEGEKALAVVEGALELSPDTGGLHYMRGIALEFMGRWEEALAEFEAALELDPWAGGIYLKMGRIYEQLGDFEKAEEMFRMELERNPNNDAAREELDSLTGRE